ncbi:Gfo/Idh/MocA family oxidoreductase [Jiella sp. MQZ9-1]|uniref:Gfo/Idh/MocA family oxidoreductase n=1 Tax=Jiella flava TaxID=2816857 RepID=A0A939FZK2_9HYPH|nr:Gfo/Idh/MocA family oxidoreductase [Jiella flava]MBO0662417.1 Gfo/Idh/MocA family oxidoreductase [Jiella flava]MCD2471641.1 Gfo/Idh/MocA family oxidoreductase [Jiella flava]
MSVGLGLIGTGFMGKAHALAYRAAGAVFGDLPEIRLACLCDTPADRAAAMARQFGFSRATDDWRALVADPGVDIVAITTPNALHQEMALAAIAAGKHVHCEKPMALGLAEAEAMERAATAKGVHTIVGYNYIHNPAFTHATRLICDGVIGRPVHFRGAVDEDYQADPDLAWTWRARRADAGLGTLGDLGCHLVSLACGLMGPVKSLIADTQIIHATRPLADGSDGRGEVENEDAASAILRFVNGAQGTLVSSRSAWGRKNKLDVEVHGTKGMIAFSQERMNELQLYLNDGPRGQQGFRTILTGPEHPPYGAFCPAPGHQLGFGDLKTIEAANFVRAIAAGTPAYPSFSDALAFEAVIHAIDVSAREGRRVEL